MKKRNQKNHLISYGDVPRVIQLDRRGPQKNPYVLWAWISAILSILFGVYFFAILFLIRFGSYFFCVWAAMSLFFGILSFLFFQKKILERIPKWIKGIFLGCFSVGIVIILLIGSLILSEIHANAEPGADYMIILGAQWRKNGPSYMLRTRLDKAIDYLQANPETIVVVTGGQGSNEHISEAEGMAGYLEAAGIDSNRIRKEAASTNTNENFLFASELIEKDKRVVVVTNEYHMFRALKLAERQGYADTEGLAADSYPGMLPNNFLREILAVMKDFLVGNISFSDT